MLLKIVSTKECRRLGPDYPEILLISSNAINYTKGYFHSLKLFLTVALSLKRPVEFLLR